MSVVLVTGSTGFLGKYIVKRLVSDGYHVIANGRNLKTLQQLKNRNVSIFHGELSELNKCTEHVDYVVHAAALSTVWGAWDEFYYNNVQGTQHVIDFCLKNNIQRLVFISSPSIYSGKSHRLNIKESEFDSTNHLNNYIRSKIMAEQDVLTAEKEGLRSTILRPRGIFGIGDTSIVPRLIKANDTFGIPLFNDGANLVDLTCVENVAYAIRLAMESEAAVGKVYNISNGEPREFKEILTALFEGIGQTVRYRRRNLAIMYSLAGCIEMVYKTLGIRNEPPLTRYTIATLGYSQTLDISNAKKELGYDPIISLDEGIRQYVASYEKA